MSRCDVCGFRIKGANHEQGSHHKQKRLPKELRHVDLRGTALEKYMSRKWTVAPIVKV